MGMNRKVDEQMCAAIRKRYEQGESFKQLGVAFGVAPHTALRAVLLAGGTVPGKLAADIGAKLARNSGPSRTVEAYLTSEGYRRVIIDEADPYFEMGSVRGKREHDRSRTVLEHRFVLARKLGRMLKKHETVHHKDGDKLNNHESNLELRVGQHGKGASEAHCLSCTCFTVTNN